MSVYKLMRPVHQLTYRLWKRNACVRTPVVSRCEQDQWTCRPVGCSWQNGLKNCQTRLCLQGHFWNQNAQQSFYCFQGLEFFECLSLFPLLAKNSIQSLGYRHCGAMVSVGQGSHKHHIIAARQNWVRHWCHWLFLVLIESVCSVQYKFAAAMPHKFKFNARKTRVHRQHLKMHALRVEQKFMCALFVCRS